MVPFARSAISRWRSAEVAARAMALFGPGSRRTLVAVPVEGGPGLVAFEDDRVVAVIKVGEHAGRVRHLEAFVRPRGDR